MGRNAGPNVRRVDANWQRAQPPLRSRLFIRERLVLNLNMRGLPVQGTKGPSYLQSTAPGEIGLAARMHDHKTTPDCRVGRPGGFGAPALSTFQAATQPSILDDLGDCFTYRTQGSKAA
jgi:hypothetical protein